MAPNSTLPACFDAAALPDPPPTPYFDIQFLLDIETGEEKMALVHVSVFSISYSDEAVASCLLEQFMGKEKLQATGITTPGRRIRVIFPMSFQIADIINASR